MKSITIHGIDDFLAERIKAKAEFEGMSVSRTSKNLLEISLGIKARPKNSNLMDFQEFSGLWSETDLKNSLKQAGSALPIHDSHAKYPTVF